MDLIPGSERFLGRSYGNLLQYSCPENPMNGRAWQAMVHNVAKSQTLIKKLNTHTHTHIYSTQPSVFFHV